MSWEEPRKIKCPICNVDMEFKEYDYNDFLELTFECPKCGLTTRLYFNEEQMISTILSKIGYAEAKVEGKEGEKSEAEG